MVVQTRVRVCTHRVDLDARLAELGVLLERNAILGHAGEDLETRARLDGADGGLGDEAGADEGVGHGESHFWRRACAEYEAMAQQERS